MPKSTSTFIKSKMNKDTDSRIIPNGEYRDAQNVNISKSEGADVGALENVLGNRALVNISTLLSVQNLEVIGHLMDLDNERIFIILTNYTDSSADQLSNFAPNRSGHYIYCYNIQNGTLTQLVEGAFLNFSKTHPIYGINLLEDLLFWTDDRNQPRKINIESALSSPATSATPYYTNEDHISVAKYYPYNPLRMYKKLGPFAVTTTGAAAIEISGIDIGSSTLEVGDIITSNGVGDGGTFSGDDPIVVKLVGGGGATVRLNTTVTWTAASTTFTFYRTGMRDVTSEYLPQNIDVATADINDNPYYNSTWPGDPEFLTDKFVRFSYRYRFDDGEYSLIAPFTQPAFIPQQDGYFMAHASGEREDFDEQKAYVSTIVDFMENKVDDITFNLDTPTIVQDLHNDYKITDIQFLYKQSNETNIRVLDTIHYTDPEIADYEGIFSIDLTSAGTAGVYCCTTNIVATTTSGGGTGMTIEITTSGAPGDLTGGVIIDPGRGYADGDRVYPGGGDGTGYFTLSIIDDSLFTYTYQSRKPIMTLPASQTTRVFDQVPIKALAQSVAGNRVIYGNFINKHTSPKHLNYSVGVSDRLLAHEDNSNFSTVQYPIHSLKQNRTYQVGIVLADRYGRQSDVILSSIQPDTVSGFGGSTVFADYRTEAENTARNVLHWWGDSLKLTFTNPIPSAIATPGYPGLYSASNPTGWYTYKVVVKQQEQEYYNVYLPSILSGNPFDKKDRNYTAHVSLYSDNINKIPKDLAAVGPEQRQFRSSEDLWARLENFQWTYQSGGSLTGLTQTRQYYPEALADRSIKIGTLKELNVGVRSKISLAIAQVSGVYQKIKVDKFDPNVQEGMGVTSLTIKAETISLGKTTEILYPGSGYVLPGDAGPHATYTNSAAGAGLTITITSVDNDGAITGFTPNTGAASNYLAGDIIELNAVTTGSGAMFIIDTERISPDADGDGYSTYTNSTSLPDAKANLRLQNAVDWTAIPSALNEVIWINPQGVTLDYGTYGTFWNYQTDPFIVQFKTQKPIGLNYTGGNLGFYNRLSVYETKPTYSNLDIYWETSSSGLVSELNTAVNLTTSIPASLQSSTGVGVDVVWDFNENDTTGTYITDIIKAVSGAGAFITSNVAFTLASVFKNRYDVTSQFYLEYQGSGGYRIKTNTEYVAEANPSLNTYVFNIEVAQTVTNNTNIYPFRLEQTIANTVPIITPVAPATCGGTLAGSITPTLDTLIATFDGVNGSANSNLRTQDLTWSIREVSGALSTDDKYKLQDPEIPLAGRKELWVKAGTPAFINRSLKIRTMDGPGAYVDCQITFTIA